MKTRFLLLLIAIVAMVQILFLLRARPERQSAMTEAGPAAAGEQLRPINRGHDRVWTVRPESFWSAMPLPEMKPHSAAWVDERIAKWRVRGGETAFDNLGFATSLQQALTIARQQNRMLFLLVDRGNVFKCRA